MASLTGNSTSTVTPSGVAGTVKKGAQLTGNAIVDAAQSETVQEAASYVGENLLELTKNLLGNLVTGIPKATYQLVGGKPGSAILTLGGSVAGPFARLAVDVTADGLVTISSATGHVIVEGLSSEEAKKFANWMYQNGEELSKLGVAEVQRRWQEHHKPITGTEFTNVTVAGKDYSVTHEFPPVVIDDEGNQLDPERDKRKIRNIMLHVPFFRKEDHVDLADFFGIPTSGGEWGALGLGVLNGFTLGALGAAVPGVSDYLDKYPKQQALGEVLSSIYGPGLAAKAVVWTLRTGRNKRVYDAIKKLATKGSRSNPEGLYRILGRYADEVLKSNKQTASWNTAKFQDIQSYRGRLQKALADWEVDRKRLGTNRQKLAEAWERNFRGLRGTRFGKGKPIDLKNPYKEVKGPLKSTAGRPTEPLQEGAGYWQAMFAPTIDRFKKNFNTAAFDTKFIATEFGIALAGDYIHTALDYHAQGLSPTEALYQAGLSIYVDAGENAVVELMRVILPGELANALADGVVHTASDLAGFGTGYTQEGLKRLSDKYDPKGKGENALIDTSEVDADAAYANRGGLIAPRTMVRPAHLGLIKM